MDCSAILVPQTLVEICQSSLDKVAMNKLFKCFYQHYYTKFERFAYSKFFIKDSSMINDAFVDGILDFYLRVRTLGFDDRGAKVETVVMTFCMNKMKGIISSRKRDMDKQSFMDPLEFNNLDMSTDHDISFQQEMGEKELLLKKGWEKLGERCRKLLYFRKIHKIPEIELATMMSIQPGTVNNEVFKCFVKLKGIIRSF